MKKILLNNKQNNSKIMLINIIISLQANRGNNFMN